MAAHGHRKLRWAAAIFAALGCLPVVLMGVFSVSFLFLLLGPIALGFTSRRLIRGQGGGAHLGALALTLLLSVFPAIFVTAGGSKDGAVALACALPCLLVSAVLTGIVMVREHLARQRAPSPLS